MYSVQHDERKNMLTVERIETIPLLVPLGRVYKGSHYQMTHRAPVIVRIFTSEGIVGEAYVADEDSNFVEISRVIDNEITPLLIGQDIRSVERCWELTRPTTFDILRDRRIGLIATAAIDTAIWDAIGKLHNEPLWRLWGGFTNSLPMIEIGGYYGTGISIEDEITQIKAILLQVSKPVSKFQIIQDVYIVVSNVITNIVIAIRLIVIISKY